MFKGYSQKITRAVSSNKFFYFVLAFFILQAVWIALSAVYPQPFDENTHFATIQLYSHHWSPFITTQPPGSGALGAITRDPSYLYQYLLSFPYRIFAHFFKSQPSQIIFLRFFGIAFFASALVLFRKVLQKTHASNALINVTLLFFVLIPVVPFLAGQLNYDNLLMLFVAGSLLLTINFLEKLVERKKVDVPVGLYAISISLLACLVQEEFLPIFIAIVAAILFVLTKSVLVKGGTKQSDIKFIFRMKGTIMATLLLLLSAVMFFQRYGVNYLQFRTPQPQCSQVLSVKECMLNGSWSREYELEQTKPAVNKNPIRYSVSWLYRMFEYSFYVRSGGNKQAYYININPLPVVALTTVVVFGFGLLLFLRYGFEIFSQDKNLVFLLFVSAVYYIVLWFVLYHGYLRTGQKYGINGRYLFPAILPVMLVIAMSYQRLLTKLRTAKPVLLIVVLLLFLQGGGIITFIVGSNRYWYWDDQLVRNINYGAQKVLKPIVIQKITAENKLKNKLLDRFHGH